MKIVLVGYMGSGKSSVGKQLAANLGYNFKDLDTEIEKKEGKNISLVFSEKGEIYFRKTENRVLKEVLNSNVNLVLATGGGTPCYADTMDFLKADEKVTTVYLKTPLEVLTNRLFKEKATRPLISHLSEKEDLNDFLRKHLFERSFYYNQATIIMNVGEETIPEIAEKVAAKLF